MTSVWIRADRAFLDLQTAIPVLVGTKYDSFAAFGQDEQEEITKQVSLAICSTHTVARTQSDGSDEQAKRFSKAMHAPLIFCSTLHSINVQCVLARSWTRTCSLLMFYDSSLSRKIFKVRR